MFRSVRKIVQTCGLRTPINMGFNPKFLSTAPPKASKPSIIFDTTTGKTTTIGAADSAAAAEKIVLLTKKHLQQSPLKMKFLVRLVRNTWVNDALAQMKFSPKHRSEDIAKIIRRGIALARIRHNAIPEELFVKEVMITKGIVRKSVRIMGRGRSGRAERRTAHVRMRIEVVDFEKMISEAKTKTMQLRLREKQALVAKLKMDPRKFIRVKAKK